MKHPSALRTPHSALHDPEHTDDELTGATRVELFIACCGLTVFVAWVFLIELATGKIFRARWDALNRRVP